MLTSLSSDAPKSPANSPPEAAPSTQPVSLALTEDQLRQLLRLEGVGRIVGGITHELAAPLQVLGETMDVLRSAFQGLRAAGAQTSVVNEVAQAIERSEEATQRMTGMLHALREFLPSPRNGKTLGDLNRALENTLAVARNEYKYVARVETDLARDLPPILCHLGELSQVFLQLLMNAAQSIGELCAKNHRMGAIQIRTARDGNEHVVISFRDTGGGIPAEIQERVFEPFFTTKEPRALFGHGSLALARAVVEQRHGGTLTFESEVGQGTTFTVRLPIGPRAAVTGRK